MRFAIYSVEGISLAFWKRLQDEGHDVLVYVAEEQSKHVGEGIVPRTQNYAHLVEWGKGGIYFFDCTNAGTRAEALRRSGQKVFGGGVFCDRLENDRNWGQGIVESVGMAVPDTHPFSTISAASAWVKAHPGRYYFKPDKDIGTASTCSGESDVLRDKLEDIRKANGDNVKNIIQEKLEGVDISTARYWNGVGFVGPYEGTIEHKAMMNDELGPATGCSLNIVWFYSDETPDIAEALHWDALADVFRANNAPPCLYDVNALIDKKTGLPNYLEWTPRLGFDADATALIGITDYGKFLTLLVNGQDPSHLFIRAPVYAGVRVSVPPYPLDDASVKYLPERKTPMGRLLGGVEDVFGDGFMGYGVMQNEKGLVVGDPSGLIGCEVAGARRHERAFELIYDHLETYDIQDVQYRTDASKVITEHLKKVVKMGYDGYG